jgi:hypothetical protein
MTTGRRMVVGKCGCVVIVNAQDEDGKVVERVSCVRRRCLSHRRVRAGGAIYALIRQE